MTVVPDRPQDGNRRPKIRFAEARIPSLRGIVSNTSELPPVLFQLPNLVPASGASQEIDDDTAESASDGESGFGSDTDSFADSGRELSCSNAAVATKESPTAGSSATSVRTDSEVRETPPPAARSFAARLVSYTTLLAVLALGGTWVFVVAKHVRTASVNQAAQQEQQGESGAAVDAIGGSSVASIEDTMANAERLAFNPPASSTTRSRSGAPTSTPNVAGQHLNGQLNAAQSVRGMETDGMALDSLASGQRRESGTHPRNLDQIQAAADQIDLAASRNDRLSGLPSAGIVQEPSDVVASVASGTSRNDSRPMDDDFHVTMPSATSANATLPNAVMADQTAASPVSSRTPNEPNVRMALNAAAPSSQTNDDEGIALLPASDLPASDPNARHVAHASTSTPNALVPPLPGSNVGAATTTPAKPSVVAGRRYSKTPTPVVDWLQYLPPSPSK